MPLTFKGIVPTILFFTLALPLQAQPVGWRTDATGRYPKADPPTEWSAAKNVAWKTPLPSWSNATPVIVDDRIFVTSEPSDLVCVDRDGGKILWTKSNRYDDLLTERQKAEIEANKDDLAALRKELKPLRREFGKLRRDLRKLQKDKEANAERIETLNVRRKEIQQQMRAIDRKIKPLLKYHRADTHKVNGYASATPVSDGEHVYVLFGTGVAACYSLDGERRWIRIVEKPNAGWGHSASPVLVDGRLMIHINKLHALDPETGEGLWTLETKPIWGTGIAARLGDKPVFVTPVGDIVDVEKGEAIARKVAKLDYSAPILHDGVLYFVQHEGAAVRLADKPDAAEPTTQLWRTMPKKNRYYASPILHEGLLYCITRGNHFSVIDAASGELVYERPMRELGKGTPYPSITLAGDLLYVSSDNGATVVLEPGREFKSIARNRLEPFRSSPVFDGTRMYIRTRKHLYCIEE